MAGGHDYPVNQLCPECKTFPYSWRNTLRLLSKKGIAITTVDAGRCAAEESSIKSSTAFKVREQKKDFAHRVSWLKEGASTETFRRIHRQKLLRKILAGLHSKKPALSRSGQVKRGPDRKPISKRRGGIGNKPQSLSGLSKTDRLFREILPKNDSERDGVWKFAGRRIAL